MVRKSLALRIGKSAMLAIFVLFCAVQVMGVVEFAGAVPHSTNILGYQGRLLNSNGVPVSDASASMIFELYTGTEPSTCVWSNSSATCASATARTVTLSDGLFSEALGDTSAATPYAAIDDSIFANNPTLFLQVTINGEVLLPRKQILASAYALNSQTLDGYNSTTTGGTASAVTVLDSNGNLQLTGNPQGVGVSQGSLYINPAAADVGGSDTLFGIAVDGSSRFIVNAQGNVLLNGFLSVGSGTINSSAAITIASSGGDVAFSPSGSGLAYVTAGDDFAVGGTSLASPFSIDESTNTVRIGDGASDANDPSIVFYGSDAVNSGTLSYTDSDRFFFTGGAVQVDDDSTPNTPGLVNGAGDLYVVDSLEVDGTINFGDTTGTDQLTFTSAVTTQSASIFTVDSLTTGKGLMVRRADNGTDFDGYLLEISQGDSGATSDGDAAIIKNEGGGDSVGLYIVQSQISDETNGAGGTTTGAQALILETLEAASNDDIMLVSAAGQLTFAIESDGSVLSDGTYSSAGADYAEYFRTADATLQESEVVCHDRSFANHVKRCEAGNTEVVGVITPTPGFVGGLPDYSDTSLNAIVGLTGQIATLATAAEGVIAVGDPITASQTQSGYAALAHGPDRIIGFALEGLSSGTGTIKVYVNPQWYGGDVLASDGSAMIATADVVLDSHDLVLRGGSGDVREMRLRTNVDGEDYRLAAVNSDGAEVAYVGDSGDFALAGRLYPSDRGAMQTSKYIFYDGSGGPGGDMMRTNAAGWSSGSYDFAEMFPSRDTLAPGEVVVFADGKEEIGRSTGETYDDRIAGVVSTSPAFLAGENRVGDVPVALAGRVPTYVSGENGTIAIGDPLTTSTKAGYAMKATEPGPIVGYAMEAFEGGTGVVVAFIRPSYYDGGPVEEAPIAENSASLVNNLATLDISGSLNMNGGSILSVASLSGIGQQWRIEEDGDVYTYGRVVQIVHSYGGEDVETYASTSRAQTITLSGTAVLQDGDARVQFEREDPAFNDIIANDAAYRVYLTPAGMTGMLAAVDRTVEGFRIQEAGSSDGIAVDWFVVAYHKDYAPVVQPNATPEAEVIVPVEPVVDPVVASPDEVPIDQEPVDEALPTEEAPPEMQDPVVVAPVEGEEPINEEILPQDEAQDPVQEETQEAVQGQP